MKPFIRWVGGKRKLLPEIAEMVAELCGTARYDQYYEPFVGGGAMFFNYYQNARLCTISDINVHLMSTYAAIRDNPDTVIQIIQKLKNESYSSLKHEFNSRPKIAQARTAALFLMLNHLCFNGLYRVNKLGHFNVPIGKHGSTTKGTNRPRTMDDFPYDSVWGAHRALDRTRIQCGSFMDTMKYAEIVRGSTLVFCDPPYLKEFSSYDKSGFNKGDHAELANSAKQWAANGALVIVCGSDNAESRQIYGAPHRVIELQRTVGASNRGTAREALYVFS